MRVVLAVVVGLMSSAAWAGDIVTQDAIQAVPRDKLDQMQDRQNRLDAAMKKLADEEVVERKVTEAAARKMNIGSKPCPYLKLPQTTSMDVMATIVNCHAWEEGRL